jgi:CRISPR system Cascade subunit CasE
MYLTKFPLNLTRRSTIALLSSPYKLHAAIAGSFPSGEASADAGRVLWRVDREPDGPATLYVVSPGRPSLVGLDEQAGWPDLEHQWVTRDYDPFLEKIADGQVYQFRLVANTVVNRSAVAGQAGRSKRLPHVTALQRASWLVGSAAYEEVGREVPEYLVRQDESRAERSGFKVLPDEDSGMLKLVVSDLHEYDIRQRKKDNRIKLSTTRYDGVLEVTDAVKLKHALTHGIGHGKGFGCGLLTLALVR